MYMTRAQLDADLFQLHAALPRWRAVLPDEIGFWRQFDTLSERLMEQTPPSDQRDLHNRLVDMLASRGLSAPCTRCA